MAQHEEMMNEVLMEQGWFGLAVQYERLKVAQRTAKLWEDHAIESLREIFRRGQIRERHDPYYAAMRDIVRRLTLMNENVGTDTIKAEFDKLLRSNRLDPGKLMDVAGEFGIVPIDAEKWKKYVEDWRQSHPDKTYPVQLNIRVAKDAEKDAEKVTSEKVFSSWTEEEDSKPKSSFTVKKVYVRRKRNGKQGTRKSKRKLSRS